MPADYEIRERRVRRLVEDLIPSLVFPDCQPLVVEAYLLKAEPLPVREALQADYEPFEVGRTWGGAWSTAWFHLTAAVPTAWAGKTVVVRIELGYDQMPGFGAEALVYEGEEALQGINSRHTYVPVDGRRAIDWYVEAAANPFPPWGEREWPRLLPDYEGTGLYRLSRAELAVRDPDIEAAWQDLRVLFDLASALERTSPRATEILSVLDAVALAVGEDDTRSSLLAARPLWSHLLREPTGRARHHVTAVGHAHIDSAWLWPIRETRRKCARTFSTALALMADNKDFVFVCSQAQQHAFVEEDHPALFERMKRAAAAGQFEPVGSMWVEPDTNIPSGESLVRQLVHGKRYFLDRYGVETTDCWLPDAFGYSGNLPQILRSAGVTRFLTQKLSWNETNKFPHHTFWWQGIDGSEVLAHCPPTDTYNGELRAAQLLLGERAFLERGVSNHSLYAFGYGDGGGGPTEDMLHRYRRLRCLDEFAGLELGSSSGFFSSVEAEVMTNDELIRSAHEGAIPTAHAAGRGGLPRWVGELYLERHRAVQTTQAAIKAANRRCEALLREAELWSAVAYGSVSGSRDGSYPAAELDRLWQTLLLHQFHDILPGSSIQWVNEQASDALASVAGRAERIASDACRAILESAGAARGMFNPASHPRREVVEVDGEPVVVSLPGLGWATWPPARTSEGVETAPVTVATEDEGLVLDNGRVRARLDSSGSLVSLFDYEHDREAIAEGSAGNVLQLHADLPNDTDAWDVDQGTFDWARELSALESLQVTESGPLRATVTMKRRFGRSSIRQRVRMRAGSKRLDFECEADWHEDHKFLKVAFPVAVRSESATYEIQFGHIRRPTHTNTSWDEARFEVAAHRWADLSEAGFGVALLNDCKYGYDVRANVMRLSLLRAPKWPDPDADRGAHRFTYALLPHGGLPSDSTAVIDEAECLNWPIRLVESERGSPAGAQRGPAAGAAFEVHGAHVSAVKPADDGRGTVVRLYESRGSHTRATVTGPVRTATRVDALERPLAAEGTGALIHPDEHGVIHLSLRPFELVTLRLAPPG